MPEVTEIDYEELRMRFPWIGLADEEALPGGAKFREVMERAHVDREAIDALDAVRRDSA